MDEKMFRKIMDEILEEKFQKFQETIMKQVDSKLVALEERIMRQVDSKLVALEERIDAKLVALEERIDAKLVALEERIDSKFVELELKINNQIAFTEESLLVEIHSLDERLTRLELKVDELSDQMRRDHNLLHSINSFLTDFEYDVKEKLASIKDALTSNEQKHFEYEHEIKENQLMIGKHGVKLANMLNEPKEEYII